ARHEDVALPLPSPSMTSQGSGSGLRDRALRAWERHDAAHRSSKARAADRQRRVALKRLRGHLRTMLELHLAERLADSNEDIDDIPAVWVDSIRFRLVVDDHDVESL